MEDLASAPGVFQIMINGVLRDFLHTFVIAYLDDILINSPGTTKTTTTPATCKNLGFGNFYRRFIRNYSIIATPHTSLTKGEKKRISWNSAAEDTLLKLNTAFTMAPVLRHPNPEAQFIVKVDASNTGVGAVLSQHSSNRLRMHPIAFFSSS